LTGSPLLGAGRTFMASSALSGLWVGTRIRYHGVSLAARRPTAVKYR
jgi:hypothetical protein